MCKSLSEGIPQMPLETEVFLERISRWRKKLLSEEISIKEMIEFLYSRWLSARQDDLLLRNEFYIAGFELRKPLYCSWCCPFRVLSL